MECVSLYCPLTTDGTACVLGLHEVEGAVLHVVCAPAGASDVVAVSIPRQPLVPAVAHVVQSSRAPASEDTDVWVGHAVSAADLLGGCEIKALLHVAAPPPPPPPHLHAALILIFPQGLFKTTPLSFSLGILIHLPYS